MIRIFYNQLRSRKQLRTINCQKVVSASFEDEKEKSFCITFDCENGKKRDLMILFETRTPKIYISDDYQ